MVEKKVALPETYETEIADHGPLTMQIMGTGVANGELLQLLVPSGVWKMSRLLPSDLAAASATPEARDHVGCLITEVVFPGFAWEDHCFLTQSELETLWGGSEEAKQWVPYVKKNKE